jgi:hypothetical protein
VTRPEPELPRLDEPPKGPVVDHDARPLSEAEAAEGRALGEAIDPDDDDDTGGLG